jgi:hypothetical protein
MQVRKTKQRTRTRVRCYLILCVLTILVPFDGRYSYASVRVRCFVLRTCIAVASIKWYKDCQYTEDEVGGASTQNETTHAPKDVNSPLGWPANSLGTNQSAVTREHGWDLLMLEMLSTEAGIVQWPYRVVV